MDGSRSKYSLTVNPYESFIKKHLQHYGYFTGRNMTIARFGYEPKHTPTNLDSDESDTESDDSEFSFNRFKSKVDYSNLKRTTTINDQYKWWLKDNLYNITQKEVEYQREPRWPVEMQVIQEKIKHITVIPNEPEAFYIKTGNEETPMNRSDTKLFRTIFYYNPTNCGYFIRSRVGGMRDETLKTGADLTDIESENTLMFESRFESGNLMKAVKISETEYELFLRYDLYTSKHTQWYYFQVKNGKPGVEYRFTICNFLKSDSLYNMGMKPLFYSEIDANKKNVGWRRHGSNIKYYKNNLKTEDENGNVKNFYSLTWTFTFPNANDTCYFAHCYPYTYSDLQNHLKAIEEDTSKSKYCKIKVLCRTLAENLVHILTITNFSNPEEENKNKKAVVITARVHPGETNSSWMMKGFLDFLLSNSPDAKLLRDTFVFKIVPMLNPDGVIVGNYRCSLTGRDLNRNYKTLLKEAFPSIWHTREMIKKLTQEREVLLYCDLHGHSRKNNVFIYGCHNNKSMENRFKEHVFPMMLSKNAKDLFSYKSCKFKIQKSKQGTGRIVMWNMGILNSFTLEATFNGSTLDKKAGYHFNTKDLEGVAFHFCDSLLDYCDPDQTKCKMIMLEVENMMKEQIRSKLESQGINLDQVSLIDLDFEKLNIDLDDDEQESSDDAGSDSSGDDGLPLHLERFAKLRERKKRKTKSRKAAISNSQQNSKTSKEQKEKKEKQSGNNGALVNKQNHETLGKEIERKLLRPLQSNPNTIKLEQIPQHPKSAKLFQNNSVPNFVEHSKKVIQLEPEVNAHQFDQNLLTFRYTVPAEIQISGHYHSSGHLCEKHRKKLNDLILLRRLKNEENESENSVSSDEESNQDFKSLFQINNETKRYIVEDSSVKTTRNSSLNKMPTRIAHSSIIKGSKGFNERMIDIRNYEIKIEETKSNISAVEGKNSLEYIPKYLLKQISDRRSIMASNSTSLNNYTTIITPFGLYNSKVINEEADDLTINRINAAAQSSKNKTSANQANKVNSNINSSAQKRLHNSSSLSSLRPLYQQQQQQKIVTTNNRLDENTDSNKQITSSTSNMQTNLFSSTFLNMSQSSKSQLTKSSQNPPTDLFKQKSK